MRKMITKSLCFYMVLAMVLTVTAIFSFQTTSNRFNNTNTSMEKLASVKDRLAGNAEDAKQLEESLGQNNLAKARAFARMVADNPSIVEDKAKLDEICKLLMVDEVHVIDGKGILRYGTVESYYGLDFAAGDQTRPMMEILKDPSLEIVQEPQPNSADGILFQYITVARKDEPGMVQVGVRPEVLENMLENTTIDKVLTGFDFGGSGYIFAIQADGSVVTSDGKKLSGDYKSAGFSDDIMAGGQGSAVIEGVKGYYVAEQYEDMVVGTFMPEKDYYAVRTNQTALVSFTMGVIFLVLVFLINRLVNKRIVVGIRAVVGDLEEITKGNLDIVVKQGGNKEFEMLSSQINSMVSSIKESLKNNEALMEQQKADMDASRELIRNVRQVCENIDHVSRETLTIAQSIHTGSEEQETAVGTLHHAMDGLTAKLEESARASIEMSGITGTSVASMMRTKDNMQLLSQSMEEISAKSAEIEKIIGEIDAIAAQTNMLSLNASIEAARAGETGRGFAVVAGQVGELAARSTQAAKETSSLIEGSIQAIQRGQSIAMQAVGEFLEVVAQIEETGDGVEQLAEMAKEQVQAVIAATEELRQISDVAEKNSAISVSSETTSERLADEAGKLRDMIDGQ